MAQRRQSVLLACAPRTQMSDCLVQFMWRRIDTENGCVHAAVQLSTCLNTAKYSLLYAVYIVVVVAS
eukprot:5269833-Pleurochrysis_carterae.AAC.1